MNALLLQFLSGLSHAMILFLIASGLSLIFGVTRTINFAHGSFFMLAAYLTTTLGATLPLGDGSVYVGALLASTEARGVEPKGLGIRSPSLEDVFLDLTGRALRD